MAFHKGAVDRVKSPPYDPEVIGNGIFEGEEDMAVQNGSLGFRRYRVAGKIPTDFRAEMETRIRQNAFENFAENDPREEAAGWVACDDLFDIDLYPDRWLDSSCVRLTLRTDRRRVPPRMLRHECEKIQASWKERFGRERLTRAEKDQIKEMVVKNLIERALPDSRGVDFYWDMERGELFFFASGEKANDLFVNLFEKTFGMKLSPVFPFALALSLLDENGRKAAEACSESLFTSGRK